MCKWPLYLKSDSLSPADKIAANSVEYQLSVRYTVQAYQPGGNKIFYCLEGVKFLPLYSTQNVSIIKHKTYGCTLSRVQSYSKLWVSLQNHVNQHRGNKTNYADCLITYWPPISWLFNQLIREESFPEKGWIEGQTM